MGSNLNSIPERVEGTEKNLVWLIQNVLRGSWFRRLVFLLAAFAVFASPAVISSVFSFLVVSPPSWYTGFYGAVVGVLLITALVVGLKTIPPPPKTSELPVDTRAVRGLLPFNLEDSALFAQLERGVELQRVLASLLDPSFRFGILVGPSGSGKTSFLRAGLLAQLKERIPAVYVELSNEDPIRSIRRAVNRLGDATFAGVLSLDQFEQFFLHQRTEEQRRPLIDALRGWYQRDSGVRVLISIRAEDAWQMIEIQESLDYQLSNQNYFKLPKFSSEQAVEVLRVLCSRASIEFNPIFAKRIVGQELCDAEDGLVSPVNLGIVILVLATTRQAFTQASFKAHGGIDGLLEEWLGSQIEAAKYQGLDKAAIRTLTALSDFDRNRRAGILTVDDITTRLDGDLTRNQVERAIQWLTATHVRLAVRVGETEAVGYQLSHERLIPAIRKAAGKLLNAAARANELLDRRVDAWVKNDKSSRFLLPLLEYRRIERQRPYLVWGESQADKEALLKQSRRRWQHRAVLAVMMVGVLLASYGAWCSNPVQRRYVKWEMGRLAEPYPSKDVARAFASLGDLPRAQDVASHSDYVDDDDVIITQGEVAVVAATTGLARHDQALVERALEAVEALDTEFRAAPLEEIAVEMARTGLARKDQEMLQRAQALAETLDDKRSSALQKISLEMAKAGLFDQAVALAKPLDSEADSPPLGGVAVEMAKAGMIEQARTLAETLGDKRSSQLRQIAVEVAKVGLARKDPALLQQAQTLAGPLAAEDRTSALREISVAMAELGWITNNQKLLEQARQLAKSLDWKGESIELWKIATLVKDNDWASTLMGEAMIELNNQQGHAPATDLEKIPEGIMELGITIKDQKLQKLAVEKVDILDTSLRAETLLTLAGAMAEAGEAVNAQEVLEQAWQEAEKMRSAYYYDLLKGITEDMTKLGHLKRAREIAESASGSARAAALAAIVAADAEVARSSPSRKV